MKYNQDIFFDQRLNWLLKKKIRLKIRINSKKIKFLSKRSKWKAFIKILVESRMKFLFYICLMLDYELVIPSNLKKN